MSVVSPALLAQTALTARGFRFTKSLGQNFLLDDDALARIADSADGAKNALEIGPGAGVLTAHLADRCEKVLAIELDNSLEPILSEVLAGRSNVRIVFADAMKADIRALTEEYFGGEPFSVAANLPYYVTTDILTRLVRLDLPLERIVALVQKEAAERICAEIGDEHYCLLSALLSYFGRRESLFDLPPHLFTPPPHVTSRLIRLTLYGEKKPVRAKDDAALVRLLTAAFAMRRKTLANNLMASYGLDRDAATELLEKAGLDVRVRGEAVSLDGFIRLSNLLSK